MRPSQQQGVDNGEQLCYLTYAGKLPVNSMIRPLKKPAAGFGYGYPMGIASGLADTDKGNFYSTVVSTDGPYKTQASERPLEIATTLNGDGRLLH